MAPGGRGRIPFVLRRLGAADLPSVESLHDQAHALATAPGLIARETREFFLDHLDRMGRIYGIESDDRIVAYCVLGLPIGTDYNFGSDIGLPPGQLAQVAHLDGAVVDPAWQGNGLQSAMVAWRIERAQAYGRRLMISTAAPRNDRSWNTLMHHRLKAVTLRRKFGGHWRYFLVHDVVAPIEIDARREEACAIDDIARQQQLFADGWLAWRRHSPLPDLRIAFSPRA